MPAASRPRSQITLADAVAMMERGVALQGQAVALLDQGAALIARAHRDMEMLLVEHTPACPTCSRLMSLQHAYTPKGHQRFWSCGDWEQHKKKNEKCTVTYTAWMKGIAKKVGLLADVEAAEHTDGDA